MMWVEEKVTVTNAEGLHARPARDLWETARGFAAEVHVVKGRIDADAKSIFDIMTLDAAQGAELLVRARGADAEAAVRAVVKLIASGFKT
jgi:phosphotransferase system HPr (HPr) family protein